MVIAVPVNYINFSESFPNSFLVNKRYKLLKPKRKVFFLVKLMLYNPLWTLKFFGWVVLNIWLNRPICLGELTKKLGELSRKLFRKLGELSKKILGELVFGWVVLLPKNPPLNGVSAYEYRLSRKYVLWTLADSHAIVPSNFTLPFYNKHLVSLKTIFNRVWRWIATSS